MDIDTSNLLAEVIKVSSEHPNTTMGQTATNHLLYQIAIELSKIADILKTKGATNV